MVVVLSRSRKVEDVKGRGVRMVMTQQASGGKALLARDNQN